MKKMILILTMAACLSCGIKGPPLPPLSDDVSQKQKAESVTVNTTLGAPKPASGDATDATKIEKKKQRR